MGVFKDIKNFLIGLGIAGKHLGRHAVTVQYPEQRDNIPEASRGIVVLLSDKETGKLNCTACELCMKVCPTAAIQIVAPRGEDKKKKLQSFDLNQGLCCFCGLCEEVCNFVAIKMCTKYEFSTIVKDDLQWDMNRLQEVGLDVPYTPKPKKKPVAKKPATDAKPDANPASNEPEAKAEVPAGNPAPAKEKAEAPAGNPGPEKAEASAPASNPGPETKTEEKTDEKPPEKDKGEV